MFQYNFRSKLIKHGWLRATSEGGNKSQSWHRIKNNATKTISDLVLLHEKLPQEKKDELYNLQNLKKLFDTLLPYSGNNDIVKLDIACYLAERSINVFRFHHMNSNKNTMAMSSVVSEYLDRASQICSDITYKEKFERTELRIPKEELRYLANWKQISTREKGNLESFLGEVMDLITDKVNIRYPQYGDDIDGDFEDVYSNKKYYFRLGLDNPRNTASLFITDKKGYEIVQKFTVKIDKGDYLLYYGKEEINKMKEKGIW